MLHNITQSLPIKDKTCWLFPGQGAQYPGMAKEFVEYDNDVKKLFDLASEITNKDLTNILLNSSDDELQKTTFAQLAIFIHSIAALIVAIKYKKINYSPEFVAGHSLGEYTALYVAGHFTLEESLTMIDARSEAMQEACDKHPSTMCAVVKLQRHIIEKELTDNNVWICNENAQGNITIGGKITDLENIKSKLIQIGGRCLPLKVAGAFHTPLMIDASVKLTNTFNIIEVKSSKIKTLSNITGKILPKDSIKTELIDQIISPVEWLKTMETLKRNNVTDVLEFGPGKVLSNLLRRTTQDIDIVNIDKLSDIENLELKR
ncbi:MAG: ACP S-malonyltransferase [Dehalococcoidia bacterium]|nr:ACP S-malonyltransferase [Dehalococcoidia bacterium]